MRAIFCVLIGTLLFSACGRDTGKESKESAAAATEPAPEQAAREVAAATVAVRTRDLPLAACLDEQTAEAETGLSQCPNFIVLALDSMIEECADGGGMLRPAENPEAWSLDVDHDGQSEMLVDLTQNYICYGAPTVFSCGSDGCPYFLYSQRADAWVEHGTVNADDVPGIEVFDAPAGTPAPLRGGCKGERPCLELTHYEWKGNEYERAWIDFRGHVVDVAPGGLWTLSKDAAVRAAPEAAAQLIDRYPAGTVMVVIGSARDAPFQFVSPCNACRRGFVEAAALTK
ncbi:MAG: hypothetical protein WD793_06050 [Steroidobacteraceae bacterium]